MKNNKIDNEEETQEELLSLIENMKDDSFNNWVMGWINQEDIIDTVKNWDTETQAEAIREIKKINDISVIYNKQLDAVTSAITEPMFYNEVEPKLKARGLSKEQREAELNKMRSSFKEGLKRLEMLGGIDDLKPQKELCPYCKSDKLELGKVKPKLYKCVNCKREIMKPLIIGGKADIENLF